MTQTSLSKVKTIFIVEDHQILRDGLIRLLSEVPNLQLAGHAGDGREALSEIERLKPDIVLLDLMLPGMNGVEIARQLQKYHSEIKVIILSQHENKEYIDSVLKYGVRGYLLKIDATEDLLKAIAEVEKDNIYLSTRLTKHVIHDYLSLMANENQSANKNLSGLSLRENEILKLIAEGKSNAEIANQLFISPQTVKTHRANLMRKLEVRKSTDLIRIAIKLGLTEP